MKERPIIFDAESVRAILAGRKTMTRRVVKPQPEDAYTPEEGFVLMDDGGNLCGRQRVLAGNPEDPYVDVDYVVFPVRSRFVPGDRLWVRETFNLVNPKAGCEKNARPEHDGVRYRATWDKANSEWRSPLFMPRWASRITLEVTEVRAERLTDISYQDVEAEGITPPDWDRHEAGAHEVLIERFAERWDALNAKRAPWDSNFWVWVVAFRKVEA